MGKCLATKLSGTTPNESLRKIAEFVVEFNLKENVSEDSQVIAVAPDMPYRVIGGYATDRTLQSNLGKDGNTKDVMYFSAGSKVYFNNKYDLASISTHITGNDFNNSEKVVHIEDFKYSSKLSSVDIRNCKIVGELSDICSPKLSLLLVNGTNITGDISALLNSKELATLECASTKLSGNISVLSSLSKLKELNVAYVEGIYGDISVLSSVEQLTSGLATKLSWKSTRASSLKIMALTNVNLGNDVDKMLINQAGCQVGTNKTISVYGTKTTASDAAVATLQQMGYTVSVTPIPAGV